MVETALEYLLNEILSHYPVDILDVIGSHGPIAPGGDSWAAAFVSRDGQEGYHLVTVDGYDGAFHMTQVYLCEGAAIALRDALNNRFPARTEDTR